MTLPPRSREAPVGEGAEGFFAASRAGAVAVPKGRPCLGRRSQWCSWGSRGFPGVRAGAPVRPKRPVTSRERLAPAPRPLDPRGARPRMGRTANRRPGKRLPGRPLAVGCYSAGSAVRQAHAGRGAERCRSGGFPARGGPALARTGFSSGSRDRALPCAGRQAGHRLLPHEGSRRRSAAIRVQGSPSLAGQAGVAEDSGRRNLPRLTAQKTPPGLSRSRDRRPRLRSRSDGRERQPVPECAQHGEKFSVPRRFEQGWNERREGSRLARLQACRPPSVNPAKRDWGNASFCGRGRGRVVIPAIPSPSYKRWSFEEATSSEISIATWRCLP